MHDELPKKETYVKLTAATRAWDDVADGTYILDDSPLCANIVTEYL